jgi:hypothetical protein
MDLKKQLLWLALAMPLAGQDLSPCDSFRHKLIDVYAFRPSQLSLAQLKLKSKEMDDVWNMVHANKSLLPCLKIALEQPDATQSLRYDGSTILVHFDPTIENKAIQARYWSDTELADVAPQSWVETLAELGSQDLDVSRGGARWLTYPNPVYYNAAHGAFEVNRLIGGIFIFGSMDETRATPTLLQLAQDHQNPGREDALWILMEQATPESIKALKTINSNGLSKKAKESLEALTHKVDLLAPRWFGKRKVERKEFLNAFNAIVEKKDWHPFQNILERVPDLEKDAVAVLLPEDVPLIRRVRRLRIAHCNQHALDDYHDYSKILMAMVWKPELVN